MRISCFIDGLSCQDGVNIRWKKLWCEEALAQSIGHVTTLNLDPTFRPYENDHLSLPTGGKLRNNKHK
jgi:hypothetical protein